MFYRFDVILIFGIFLNQSLLAMNELKRKKIEVTVFNDSKNLVIVKYDMGESVFERVKVLDYKHERNLCCMERLMPNKYSSIITISNIPTRWVDIYFNNEKTVILVNDEAQDIVKTTFAPQEVDGVWEMKPITGKREALKSDRINALMAMVKANGSIELKPS